MVGKATGERIPGKKRRAIVEAAAIGDPINRIARKVGVTWRTADAVVKRESREIAERKEALLKDCITVAERATAQVLEQLPTGNLQQSATVAGIYMDKIAQLSGDPDMIVKHEHQHFHPRQHHFEAFTREKWNEILAQLPDNDSVSQSTPATPSAPSLFLPEPQDTAQEAQDNATVAVPAQEQELAQESSGMHSHSQPDSSKKAAAFAARLRADEKKN